MKTILLSILFVITVHWVQAQRFEVGFNVGNVLGASGDEPDSHNDFNRHGMSAYVLKGLYHHRKMQYGVAIGYRNSYTKWLIYPDLWPGPVAPPPTVVNVTMHEIPVTLFMNRRIRFNHGYAYGGISVGAVSSTLRETPTGYYDQLPDDLLPLVGAQVGISWFVTKHIGLNAEAGVGMEGIPFFMAANTQSLTLGVCYGFYKKKLAH